MLDNFKININSLLNLDTLSNLDNIANQSKQMLASLTGQHSCSIDAFYDVETNHLPNTESRLKTELFEGIEYVMPSVPSLIDLIDESVCAESLATSLRTDFSESINSSLTINSLANIAQDKNSILSQYGPDISIPKEFNSMVGQAAIGESYLLEVAESATARAELIGASVNEATNKQVLGDSLENLGDPSFNFLFQEIKKYESNIAEIFSSSSVLENSLTNFSMVNDTKILSSVDLLSSSMGVDRSELLSAVNASKYLVDSVESIINSTKFTLGDLISPFLGDINEDDLLADLNSENLESYSAAGEVIKNVIKTLSGFGDKRHLYLLICKLKPYLKAPLNWVAGGIAWDLLSPHIKPLVLGFFINNGVECKTETNITVFSDITYEVPIYVIPKNVSITVIHDKKSGTVSVSKKDIFGRSIHGYINPEQSCSK